MKTTESLWLKALDQIQNSLDPKQFEMWFSDIDCATFTPAEVRISVPTPSCKEYLIRRFRQDIYGAIKKVSGWSPRVVIEAKRSKSQETDLSPQETLLEIPVNEQEEVEWTIPLSPDLTFDNFITGPCNQLASAAAAAVAENPGEAYNPFFVHSAVGMGKTHLLQAICHAVKKKNPATKILYIPCERLVNTFIRAIERGELEILRYRFRDIDILAVDDVHFLANKERTQEEFFHTFNMLYHSQKQIVLSSDSPPKEIPSLQERLVTRFNWGLVACLEFPEYETRVAIVKKKARLVGHIIPDDVAEYIASEITSNIRELEGAVVCVLGTAELTGSPLSVEIAKDALKDSLFRPPLAVRISDITEVIAKYFSVKETDIIGKRRLRSIVIPRQICMFLSRKYTPLSLSEIGIYFGGKDHSTVLHSIEKIDCKIKTDNSFAKVVEDIERLLQKK